VILDFPQWAFLVSLAVAILAVPLFFLLRVDHHVPPLMGFVLVMLAFGGVVGSVGRLVDESGFLDYWVRIFIIASRVAVLGAMLYDIAWLRRRRTA